ncbi:MAG TPA: VWA domain-containing protein [Thermoanaerobaculia bacterium]|nr:VWA domain-containing protein [Thermoanaerobaculia bacterium]
MKIAVAVALLVAGAAVAQESAVIDVQVTNLDVVVTDSKGKRVTGLTKADFEVLEDGVPREITNLSEISRNAAAMTETIQPAPRRILLIVDNGTIALAARRKVFDATRATLDKLVVNSSDRIAIATISRSIKERLGWTSDREAALKVLAEIEKDAILPNLDVMAFERSLEDIISEAQSRHASMAGSAPQGGTGDGTGENPPGGTTGGGVSFGGGGTGRPPVNFQYLVAQARAYAASTTNDTRQTISALNAAMTAFQAMPGGRRIAIIVGGALPMNAADAVFQQLEAVREQFDRPDVRGMVGMKQASTLTQISAYDLGREIDGLANSAKLKGIAIYAVNPEFGDRMSSGVNAFTPVDSGAEFSTMRGMLDGYNRLAVITGGAAMIGRPAQSAVAEIVSDLDSYYSLGYRAAGPLNPQTQIAVKVRKGLNARATLASGAISRDWQVADQVLANHIAEPANPLNISVSMDPAVVAGEKKMIPMTIRIPVNSLTIVENKGEYTASFAVFISLGNTDGGGSDPSRQEQSFRWPANLVEQVKGKTIGFAVSLEASADRDHVSVGVLDQHSGAAGFTRVRLP